MDGHAVGPSQRIPALQEHLARWSPRIHPVKSAEEEFQENLKEAQDLFKALTDSSQNPFDKLNEIGACVTRMQQLTALHEDTKEQKEREYQQNLLEQEKSYVIELFDIFGLELVKAYCKIWCDRRGHPSWTDSTQPDPVSSNIDTEPKDTTTSRFTPIPDQPTSTSESQTKSTTKSPGPLDTENTQEPSIRPSEPDTTEHNTSVGPQKRPSEPPAARPTKRSRSDVTQDPLVGDRTIEFEQVYQNGQAEPKYVIAKYKGCWYILECKEHRLHFNNDPIRGAAKHLRGKRHNQTSVTYEDAIRALGTRVLGCEEKDVEDNNAVARRPCYSQMGRPVTSLSPSGGRSIPTRSNQSPTVIDPKPGEVYTTFWGETKEFFAILVLPWHNAGQLGTDLTLTVKDTDLIEKVPSCYQYNDVNKSFDWAPEYRPEGQHYSRRKYPIMYFDAAVFPEECRVNWIAAREFALYDPRVSTTPYKELVDGFIAWRNNGRGEEAGPYTSVELDGREENLGNDIPTAEIFPREQPSGSREIIVIDDDSDDDTGSRYQVPDISIGSDDPVPKTEPLDEYIRDVHDQQDTSTTYANAPSQPIVPTSDHTQLCHDLPEPQLLTGDAPLQCPTSCDMHTQTPNHGPTSQWPPTFLHDPSLTDNTHIPPAQLFQQAPSDTRVPEAIIAPLPPDQNSPPVPNPCDSSVMQTTTIPCQDAQTTELYAYFNQARSASSQFQLDSDGHLRWITPLTPSGVTTKQKPLSTRQHKELKARILPVCKEPQFRG
ncbi:hypothetical protein FSST1_009754 [Fusarium sambucinum]